MGAVLKYIIPIILFAFTAVFFQNCGNKLQGNGDPYETPDDGRGPEFGDPLDPTDPTDPLDPVTEIVDRICNAANSSARILRVTFGSTAGVDNVTVLARAGQSKTYPWTSTTLTLTLNNALNSSIYLRTVTVLNGATNSNKINVAYRLTIPATASGPVTIQELTEVLNCQ